MHDFNSYEVDLIIYIIAIAVVGLLVIVAGNLLLWILKLSRVFSERKVWLLANLIGIVILTACIVPAALDICQSSYCTINEVVNIENVRTKYSSNCVLVTGQNGKVYTCYNYLIETDDFDCIEFPVTVVYAQHSRLILYISPSTDRDIVDSANGRALCSEKPNLN